MKYIIFFVISLTCHAETYDEVLGGSLTYHLYNPGDIADRFNYKVNSDGTLISNPLVSFRQVTVEGLEYQTWGVFTGANSVAEPIAGALWSAGLTQGPFRLGVVAGAYAQDAQPFYNRNIVPFMVPEYGWGVVPLVGFEATQTFPIFHNKYFIFNELFTPVLFNATVGFGWTL